MIDVFEPNGEYTLMRSVFDGEAAKRLQAIRLLSSSTFTEDFRRAVAIYDFFLELESKGSKMRAFAPDGMEEIKTKRATPLADTSTDETDRLSIGVAINLNNETVAALEMLEETEGRSFQDILDSIVVQYADIVERSFMGEQFIIESNTGEITELVLLDSL